LDILFFQVFDIYLITKIVAQFKTVQRLKRNETPIKWVFNCGLDTILEKKQ
jgi:hypothetical protein